MADPEYVRLSKPDYEGWLEEDSERTEDSTTSKNYDANDYVSGPIRVKDGTVPINILEFHHSYAYDCRRYFNLCVADPSTVIFASGNLIHVLNTENGSLWFRRSSTGGGIGHITKNPSANHVAVGENGIDPPIIIYEWPSMKIVTVLLEGTTRSYSHLAYSPDGLLLLSQGGDPDYLITVWNWKKSRILLRCKSHGQDIYNAAFSPTVPGHLTTSGAGHIKFWKMARTFTGLKLKGELGRFGKTEISDIIGVYSMPDEKVVSGCEWGNILLWDEDLIKLEVCRKGRKTCHSKMITQFEYNNGELVSVGMDGWIRVWYYESIDQADPPDDDRFLQIDPIYEFEIKEADSEDWEESSMLMCIMKQYPDDPERTLWYAQDGNGGLWSVDLGTFENPKQPKKLLTCHAGPIKCMDVATWNSFVATCGQDGHLHIYNYSTKTLIMVHRFNDKGSRVVWFPCSVESTGSTLACAFESGIVRVVTVAVLRADKSEDIRGNYVRLIQVSKPHTSAITAMSINPSKRILVTGSEDRTLFVFSIEATDTYPNLVPIGYVRLFSGVSCMTWKPDHPNTILVGCSGGDCSEVELPDQPQEYTTVSYELVQYEPKFFKFQSVKSKIRRELARLEIERKKEAERESKREKMDKLRADNPGIEIDEEAFLMEDEEDPPLPEIYVPEVPNPVLMANYTADGTIWLSMAGYDAGYVYEYPVPEAAKNVAAEPIRSTVVFDADDTEIRSCLFYEDKYLFLGMEHGEIRVCRVNPDDHTDFSDYWILPMHDNGNGAIPVMSLSHDRKMLLSCGYDGNLFSYVINDDGPHTTDQTEKPKSPRELPIANVEDIEEPDHLSLEEVIVKSENDRIMAVAKRKKDATLKLVRSLAEEYNKIIERNRALPESQRIPQEEFELDPRITADLNNQLKAEMDLVHQKLAFKVEKSRLGLQKLMDHFIEPITCLPFAVSRILKPNTVVHSLRERKLGDDFAANYADVMRRIEEKEKAERIPEEKIIEEAEEEEETSKAQGLETFLNGLSPVSAEYRLGVQINQMLRKYRARKERMDQRAKQWKIIHASKPDPNVNHPDDVAAIEQAKNTIGDYKLKISPNFSQSQEKRETTLTKYKELMDCRKKTHNLREDFNARLRSVRDKKLELQNEVLELIEKLKAIHAEIPEKKIKPLPEVPFIDFDVEYPERNLELEKYTSMAERVKETKRKKMSMTEEIIINPMDEEYEVLLLDEKLVESELEMSINTLESTIGDKVHKAVVSVSPEVLEALNANDRIETPWEREMKRARATRKIYEQDSIIMRIENSYEELDQQLDELERERLDITADSVYADLFLLTLHQELIILRDYEAMENLLTDKVNEKLTERDVARKKIESMNAKIEQKNREIVRMHDKIKDVIAQFTIMTSDNKFANFLRRIFKKKFKPPKEEDDDSSTSDSSSSESSSEDDGASLRSDELGPIHMDEGICPTGCEREVYNSAFTLREERYECEHRIKEEQRAIELLHKEVDSDVRKLKVVENELKVHRKDLEDFMREKQNKLNDVDVTVIMKFHQLQHFVDDGNSVAKIHDCVVFDKDKLTRLYARVGELQQETLEQKEKHKKNREHLHRMKVDCKHMDGEIKHLKEKIKQEMMQKFGREVSLSSLYEAVLRKMIYDLKADLKEMTKGFDKQIKCVKDKYHEQVEILENLIQDNTEKLSFMTVLEGEHAKLKKILRHTPESEENILRIEQQYREDLARLESILRSQRHQKELFRNDIRNLSLKTRSLPPICTDVKRLQASRKKSEEKIDSTIFDALGMSAEETATTDSTQFESEEGERIEDTREIEGHENTVGEKPGNEEDSQTATIVHRLLSRVIESAFEDKEADGSTQEILRQVIGSLPAGGSVADLRVGIERSVDRIIEALPQEDEETVEAMRQAVKESLTEIVTRLEDESRTVETRATEIGWNMRQKIGDLFDSMGIKRESKIQNTLIKLLKTDDGIETAIEYLSRNVQTTPDVETLAALREHAFRTLTEIREEMNTEDSASPLEIRTGGEEQIDESEAT